MAYLNKDGSKMSNSKRSCYGWPLGMPFGTHFWNMAQQDGMQAVIIFHQAFLCDEKTDRKKVLNSAQSLIKNSVLKTIEGKKDGA